MMRWRSLLTRLQLGEGACLFMSLFIYLYTQLFLFFGVWILDCRFYFTLIFFALLLYQK